MATRRSAFTLTEILIVIGLIVLLLAIAVPAFNLISGGKSIEGAANQLSAALGRARAQAIGLQKTSGVLFFVDPRNDRRSIAIVQETDAPNPITANPRPDVWLDLSDADFLPLPAGISAQLVSDCTFTGAPPNLLRASDGYIGYNATAHQATSAPTTTEVRFGGVILFDANGRLTSKTYGFRCVVGTTGNFQRTALGKLLNPSVAATTPTLAFDVIPGPNSMTSLVRSQFGLVMYQQDAFMNATGGGLNLVGREADASVSGANYMTIGEKPEEDWLDNNATPLMINRYNGTLVKGD
jgi:type II secretory pathway pseudopilin PulG